MSNERFFFVSGGWLFSLNVVDASLQNAA